MPSPDVRQDQRNLVQLTESPWRNFLFSTQPGSITPLTFRIAEALQRCQLPEYAARLKPVIPDYDWNIVGIRSTVSPQEGEDMHY
ncbi:hypothetical protein SAMN05192562_1011267 [Kosakonia arachidis]|uniref:Uncharacterized protein n=1 Tax=Kosakonia arachidis TaxID=551989 RepID=A0A1I6ZN59_9ENTR|nr:hypothetical protein SAMN05192562_1011267 [Kosakonia arachidis]